MSITYQILGTPDNDNALFVLVDSGQAMERLLFDCGDGCVSTMGFADVQAMDHLFFSHLHMDHVGGFDSFFRCTFHRDVKPNRIWGPPDTARILQHRFQGFLWNLNEEMSATWHVCDIHPQEIRTTRFELREAFSVAHEEACLPYDNAICEGAGFVLEAISMEHRTPTIAYVVREKRRQNIDTSRLAPLGLTPGPWLKQVKEAADESAIVEVAGTTYSIAELRRMLLVETPGDSIAYLTDFLLDEQAMERLATALQGCKVIVCEGQYRHADIELARKNYHMTTVLAATLAKRIQAQELVLFHLSDRYDRSQWLEMLTEARQVFPRTRYPSHWGLDNL